MLLVSLQLCSNLKFQGKLVELKKTKVIQFLRGTPIDIDSDSMGEAN